MLTSHPPTSLSVQRARLINLAYLHTYILTYLDYPLVHLHTYILVCPQYHRRSSDPPGNFGSPPKSTPRLPVACALSPSHFPRFFLISPSRATKFPYIISGYPHSRIQIPPSQIKIPNSVPENPPAHLRNPPLNDLSFPTDMFNSPEKK